MHGFLHGEPRVQPDPQPPSSLLEEDCVSAAGLDGRHGRDLFPSEWGRLLLAVVNGHSIVVRTLERCFRAGLAIVRPARPGPAVF